MTIKERIFLKDFPAAAKTKTRKAAEPSIYLALSLVSVKHLSNQPEAPQLSANAPCLRTTNPHRCETER
ncbi:hypothetical protein PSEUDO8Z_60660 [Pseudomonas sp. 8Z]|nr:hypothetical protein PSEUDO8Z_60660 [Pseudomonas sp. 8Z]